MARSPKYPLDALLELREQGVDDATAELGAAIAGRERDEAAWRAAEDARRAAEARAEGVRRSEATRLEGGELRAVDLARAAAWEVGARAAIAGLAQGEERALEKLNASRASEHSTRDALAQRTGERDVIAKNKGRFVEASERAALAAEEESAEEAWQGRKGGR